jgi:hypothetical protein
LVMCITVSPVMATQPKAKNTVYSTVRPEFIYPGQEFSCELSLRVPSSVQIVGESEFRVTDWRLEIEVRQQPG